jgi:hypothetical protein
MKTAESLEPDSREIQNLTHHKPWQFFGAGAFGQFGGEKGERKRRRKFPGASFQLLCKEYH